MVTLREGRIAPGDTIDGGDARMKCKVFLRLNLQEHRINRQLESGEGASGDGVGG